MKKSAAERIGKINEVLATLYPEAECELDHGTPLELLVSTILSAQCTDVRVNMVTPELFRRFKTARDYASVPREELEDLIRSTGFFRSKAKSIQEACEQIDREFGGKVPDTMEDLVRLRGVGRKTANVILGSAFGKNEGVVVDTHVLRLSRLLGLTKQKAPEKVEKDLMKLIPKDKWTLFSHQLIWHGRRVCKARKPDCPHCKLAPLCPSVRL